MKKLRIPRKKLTDEEVQRILHLSSIKCRNIDIAAALNIHTNQVSKIIRENKT